MSDQPAGQDPKKVKSVVVLVHGIRTYAPWVAMVRAQLEGSGIVVQPTNYGRLDAVRFLWGSRRKTIDAVWESVRDVVQMYPNAKISFLAHSFGTYIVAALLRREFDFKAHRVIFCGSVVRYRFPFNQFSDRFTPPLVNETSARDPWPVLAECSSWGYGSAGTYGFRVPRVRDRWHRGFGHSQFLTEEFCKKFWVPFFKSGTIVEGDLYDETPPFWIRFISGGWLKYVFLSVILLVIGSSTLRYFDVSVSSKKYPNPIGLGSAPPINSFPHPSGAPDTSSDVGPKPGPDCYLVQSQDNTVVPQIFTKSWKCPP